MIGLQIVILSLIMPMFLGMLVVDLDGNVIGFSQSIINFSDHGFGKMVLSAMLFGMAEDENTIKNPETITLQMPFEEKIGGILTIFVFSSYEFGIQLGVLTAPFNYLAGFLLIIIFVIPSMWLWLFAFVYLAIKERKEIRNIASTGISNAQIGLTFKSSSKEIILKIKNFNFKNIRSNRSEN